MRYAFFKLCKDKTKDELSDLLGHIFLEELLMNNNYLPQISSHLIHWHEYSFSLS